MNRRQLFKTISLGGIAALGLKESAMTQPVSHGYPDWGRQTAASDIVVVNSIGLNLTALTQTAIFFVGNLPYLYVRISSASSSNVGIAWFADAAGTISLFGDVVTASTGGDGTQCIPVRGPYVRFTLERGAYPGTVNFQAIMVSTPFAVYGGLSGENVLIEVDNVSVAAAATLTVDATSTRGGWIHWGCDIFNAAFFFARLYAVDFGGTAHLLHTIYRPGTQVGGMMLAPALPLRVVLNNNDGVAHFVSSSVAHHPFYP